MNKETFIINTNDITERKLVENCLNYYHSGYDYKFLLLFYALAHQWKADKVIYYINLLKKKNEK